jgi:hypothetical protein
MVLRLTEHMTGHALGPVVVQSVDCPFA